MTLTPELPDASYVEIPGRGRAWVYDSGPAKAASSSSPAVPAAAAAVVGTAGLVGTATDPVGPAVGLTAEARPVVLMHGWTSTAGLTWYQCFPALAERGRVVAMDHRAHGRGIQSRTPVRLEECADDAAALIETLDLGPSTVVGYSMGGSVAQLLWRRHPKLVGGLVLCATAARFPSRRRWRGPIGSITFSAATAMTLAPAKLRRFAMSRYARSRTTTSPWMRQEWGGHDLPGLMQMGLSLSLFDSTGWIPSIDVPTAVVITTADTVVAPWRQIYLAKAVPDAVTFEVQGEHRACVDIPDQFVPILLDACQAVEGRPALA